MNRRQFLGNSVLTVAGGSLLACFKGPALGVANANSSDDKQTDDKEPVTVVRFSDSGQKIGPVKVKKVRKTDAEWKKQLTALQFEVTRQQGTETPFTGATYNLHE